MYQEDIERIRQLVIFVSATAAGDDAIFLVHLGDVSKIAISVSTHDGWFCWEEFRK